MTTTAYDRALLLLAEVDTVAAYLESAGPHASDKDHEHRTTLTYQLAELVPDLVAEMDSVRAALPAVPSAPSTN